MLAESGGGAEHGGIVHRLERELLPARRHERLDLGERRSGFRRQHQFLGLIECDAGQRRQIERGVPLRGAADGAFAAAADDFERFAARERRTNGLLDLCGVAHLNCVGHRTGTLSVAAAAAAEWAKTGMMSRAKRRNCSAAAGDGEQDISDARVLQRLEHRADFIRRAVHGIFLGASGLASIGEHVRTARALRRPRHVDGALGIGGLTCERRLFVGVIFGDVELARHRHLHRIERQPACLAFGFVDADAFADCFARWHIDRGSD